MSGNSPSSVLRPPSSGNLYRIIRFPVRRGSCGGSLLQFQPGDGEENALPFKIGKVLVMSDIRTDDVRGLHAHFETEEILVALSGGCTVDLDDGRGGRAAVRLSASEAGGRRPEDRGQKTEDRSDRELSSVLRLPSSDSSALLLYPHIWRVLRDFEPGTTLLVVANMLYDEADYIRDEARFRELAQTWDGPGGSASTMKEPEGGSGA